MAERLVKLAYAAGRQWLASNKPCACRCPPCSCQYQQPSEAAVLKAARITWQAAQPPQGVPAAEPASSVAGEAAAPAAATTTPSAAQASSAATGPLLLFPDTSALLPMLGAGERVSLPTFFTLELLEGLARAGRFGRALPPQEQVGWVCCLVVHGAGL